MCGREASARSARESCARAEGLPPGPHLHLPFFPGEAPTAHPSGKIGQLQKSSISSYGDSEIAVALLRVDEEFRRWLIAVMLWLLFVVIGVVLWNVIT